MYDAIPYQVKQGQAIGASLQKMWKSHIIPISTKIRLMKALVWPVAMYGCESLTPRKNEETRLDAFEIKGLKKILQVSWTAKKTNGFLTKLGVKRELLDTVKEKKLAYSRLAAWRSGNGVGRINEVTLRRTRLVLGWVTCLCSTPGGGTLFRYVTSQSGQLSLSSFRGR